MSMSNLARFGAAAVCLLSVPALAVPNYGVSFSDANGNGSGLGSPVPFAAGSIYGGGTAGKNLVTAYAQTTPFDLLQSIAYGNAGVENTLDLSGLATDKLTLHYALQIGGIDTSYGTAAIASYWSLSYTNGNGYLVGLLGTRNVSATGVVNQQVLSYDGSGNAKLYSKHFAGVFNYNLVINPLVTSMPDLIEGAGCQITEAPSSGGYCAVNFGFGIPPKPPVAQQALIRFAGREVGPTVGGVPEPGSWALLAAGFGIVGAASRRRGRAVVAA